MFNDIAVAAAAAIAEHALERILVIDLDVHQACAQALKTAPIRLCHTPIVLVRLMSGVHSSTVCHAARPACAQAAALVRPLLWAEPAPS